MLTMLSWASAPHPFGKKAQVKPQKNFVSSAPRTVAVQTYTTTHTTPAYSYAVSGSYVLDSMRPPYNHAGHPVTTPATPYITPSSQLYGQPQAPPVASEFNSSGPHHSAPSTSPSNGRRSFKIYPCAHNPLAYIYERSEDARSETMTSYSSDSASIYSSTTATSSTISQSDYGRDPRRPPTSILSRDDARQQSPLVPQAPHQPPLSLPPSSNSSLIVRSDSNIRNGEIPAGYSSPPGRGTDPGRRRGSGSSDSDDTTLRSARPNVLRKSPPRIENGVQFPSQTQSPRDGYSSDTYDVRAGYTRIANGTTTPGPSREAPALHRDDSYIDMQRTRRMSGANMMPGTRERTSPVEANGYEFRTPMTNTTAVVLRNTPSRDRACYPSPESSRDRTSPDRERISAEPIRERRLSNATAQEASAYFDRPMLGRNTSASSRGRPSVPDEPQRGHAPKPVPIRARTLSMKASRDPPNVVIAGVETATQCRTVRFSENLICPSPVPMEKRRKGWFNKRGDQLWTNDGGYVRPEATEEYPPDLNEYPEAGAGWMNEEGIRIDVQHRLIPKVPLRPALKRTSISNSSSGTVSIMRPESQAFYTSPSIRE